MSLQTEGNAPVRKVTAGGLAGAIATILVFVLNTYALPGTKQLTPEIAAALTTVFSIVVAYMTPPGRNENVIDPEAQEAPKAKAAGA